MCNLIGFFRVFSPGFASSDARQCLISCHTHTHIHTHTHTHTNTIKRANRFQMEWQSVLLEIINDLLRKSVYSVCRMRPVRIMMVRKHCWSMAHNLHSTTAVIINNTNTNQFKSTISTFPEKNTTTTTTTTTTKSWNCEARGRR